MQRPVINHYATLGLDRRCTREQIQAAYRRLVRQLHPDLNPHSPAAVQRTQELNAAREILSDPELRKAHDRELDASQKTARPPRAAKIRSHLSQNVNLRLEELLHGATRQVRINDPANPDGEEVYELVVPPNTPPGTRFRLPRTGPFAGSFVQLRTRALPHFRFKPRGSELRCDLKIKPDRAAQGGTELMRGLAGAVLRVPIPRGVGSGEILRVPGEGLPKPRGGRGDLLVRIMYRVPIRVSRMAS